VIPHNDCGNITVNGVPRITTITPITLAAAADMGGWSHTEINVPH